MEFVRTCELPRGPGWLPVASLATPTDCRSPSLPITTLRLFGANCCYQPSIDLHSLRGLCLSVPGAYLDTQEWSSRIRLESVLHPVLRLPLKSLRYAGICIVL
jgi:hypothetical protein